MIPFILLGTLLVGGTVIGVFWNEIKQFLKKAYEAVKNKIKEIIFGVKSFIKKVATEIYFINKFYSKDKNGNWLETMTTSKLKDESQVPADILERSKRYGEVEITEELQNQLGG